MQQADIRRYRGLVLWGPFEEVTGADLDQVEAEIGTRLPADFRSFLLAVHGGRLPYAVKLPPGDPDARPIQFDELVEATGEDGIADLWAHFSASDLSDALPPALLPVAHDGGGSLLFVALGPDSFGEVWAYVAPLPEWAGGDGQASGGRVAGSWDEYLDGLAIDEDFAEVTWQDASEEPDDAWAAAVVTWLDAGLPEWRSSEWA